METKGGEKAHGKRHGRGIAIGKKICEKGEPFFLVLGGDRGKSQGMRIERRTGGDKDHGLSQDGGGEKGID